MAAIFYILITLVTLLIDEEDAQGVVEVFNIKDATGEGINNGGA